MNHFIGCSDVNYLTLYKLNGYDLYNTCNTNKQMLAMCQQDPLLWNKYLSVHDIVKNIDYYYQYLKNRAVYVKVNSTINLLNLFPHLDPKYNINIRIKEIVISNVKIKLYPFIKTEPTITFARLKKIQILTFLINMSIHDFDFYDYIDKYMSTNYKRKRSARK